MGKDTEREQRYQSINLNDTTNALTRWTLMEGGSHSSGILLAIKPVPVDLQGFKLHQVAI
jgi:hypothetical protein